ncbi:unnamed protein product [Effrenium voratum]|uniref:J domain-containing protein n=1 Tax=Effrenium voratum TaxID=2562239 RepID=A0AA36IEY3_9DINO|nr:unnamed protein product [Effrenium voratum]
MAEKSLAALPPSARRAKLPAVKAGILRRLLSQARHDEPTASATPAKAASADPASAGPPGAAPAPPQPDSFADAFGDDEELERLRCTLRRPPTELPPPQDGVEAFGDEPWFAEPKVRQALEEAVEAAHGSFKILVGDPGEEIARICPSNKATPLPGAVLRLGGAHLGGFGEPDIAYAFRQLSRALHPDKNPDNPDAGDAFKRLKEAQDELKQSLDASRALQRRLAAPFPLRAAGELKRPQSALFAEASRLLGAVLALKGQGWVPRAAQQRAQTCLRLPERGGWAQPEAAPEHFVRGWLAESGELLEAMAQPALRSSYDCAPKRYRAHFLCLLARAAQIESDSSDGCVRRQWSKIWETYPEIQLWQQLRQLILKKRQVHGRQPKRDAAGNAKMADQDWSSWSKRWRKLISAVLPGGEDEAAPWSDPELRKLCAALWRDFADPLEKDEGEDGELARRCLMLFRAESRGAADVEQQRGAAPAEWAFVPAADLLLLVGEGLVGVTVEGVFVRAKGRLPFASAIFQTMISLGKSAMSVTEPEARGKGLAIVGSCVCEVL